MACKYMQFAGDEAQVCGPFKLLMRISVFENW